jgi:hypothetical protein
MPLYKNWRKGGVKVAGRLSKKEKDFYRNNEFYKVHQYGDNIGHPDTSRRYKVRSIGPKQCILDYVREEDSRGWYNRGHTLYLATEEEAQRRMERGYNNRFVPTRWSQLLIPVGNEGWDPDINF